MYIILYKKYFLYLFILLLIIITGVRMKLLYSQKKMPKFSIKSKDNRTVYQRDFKGFNTKIIFLSRVGALSLSLIDEISKYPYNQNEKILIISTKNMDIAYNKQLFTAIVDSTSWKTIINKKFKLSPNVINTILVFNEAGLLERTYSVRDYFQVLLNRVPSKIDTKLNVNNIIPAINHEFQNYNPGIYYLTNNICSSCQQIKIYEKLEKMLISYGKKLNIVLSDNWEKIDLENLIKERNMNINVVLASISLQNEISTWKNNYSSLNFAFLIIKSDTSMLTFPMIDYNDYKTWKKYILNNNLRDFLKNL